MSDHQQGPAVELPRGRDATPGARECTAETFSPILRRDGHVAAVVEWLHAHATPGMSA